MTKLKLIPCLLIICFQLSAQDLEIFKQNRVMLSGAIGFHFDDHDHSDINVRDEFQDSEINHSSSSLWLRPKFGVFTKDGTMLGVAGHYNKWERDQFSKNDRRIYEVIQSGSVKGVSAFIKQMYPLYKRFGASLEHKAGYSWGKTKINTENEDLNNLVNNYKREDTEKQKSVFAEINVSLYLSINDHFLIESNIGRIGYNHTKFERFNEADEHITESSTSSGNLSFITTLSLHEILTLSYIF